MIGAMCGVFAVQLIEYVRGFFFVDGQDESDFITVMAFGLKCIGLVTWTAVLYIVFLILREVSRSRERR